MTIRRIGQSAGKTGFGRNPQRLHERLPTGPAGGDDKVQTATPMATAGESPCGRLIRWSWVQVPPGSLVHVCSNRQEMTQRDDTPGFPAIRSPVSSPSFTGSYCLRRFFAPHPHRTANPFDSKFTCDHFKLHISLGHRVAAKRVRITIIHHGRRRYEDL